MNNEISFFKAWMGSPQGLSVATATILARDTGALMGELEIHEEMQPYFTALVEGLIVSNYNHAPSRRHVGGPIITPGDAIGAACDWMDGLTFAQGVKNAAMTESEVDGMQEIITNS